MAIFQDRFSDRDWALLTQLPFSIGLWLAHQDQGGGPRAGVKALAALDSALTRSHVKFRNIPLVAELTAPELHEDTRPGQWANVLQDCKVALALLRAVADERSVNCFRILLIEIAESVARAAPNGEWKARNLYNGPKRGWLGLYPLMANAVRLGRGPKVTRTEKQAINKLISALDAQQLVQDWELDPFRELNQA